MKVQSALSSRAARLLSVAFRWFSPEVSRRSPAGLSPERLNQLDALQNRLGYRFQDLLLLEQALCHKSYAFEAGASSGSEQTHYESLEFLGDAILGFVMAEALYRSFDGLGEGELTKIRGHLVSTRQLAGLSRELGLGDFVLLSRGEEKTGGRNKRAILADLFESVIAAVYLDGELQAARDFVLRQFGRKLRDITVGALDFRDSKSLLQEHLHSVGTSHPRYSVVQESGPEHRKIFVVAISLNGQEVARGRGSSKKEAEQQAAEQALSRLNASREIDEPVGGQSGDVVKRVGHDRRGQTASPEENGPEG